MTQKNMCKQNSCSIAEKYKQYSKYTKNMFSENITIKEQKCFKSKNLFC